MESLFVFVIIAVIVLVVVVPASALILAASARRQANEAVRNLVSLSRHVADLQAAVRNLNQQFEHRHPPAAESRPPTAGQPAPSPMAVPPAADEPAAAPGPAVPTLLKPVVAPPPLILPSPSGREAIPTAPPPARPTVLPWPPAFAKFNWEQFLGVKLFAWAAGLALFLGVGFFLKWSFDKGLITPPIRVAMGFVAGIGLLIGGLRVTRPRYDVLAQALTAAGVLILYADIFASCSFYHFIPNTAAFALMVLVTVAAFLVAVRLDAPAVAILGLLGGFLTPPLLSTGEDHPIGLFGYIALLDIGLLALALRKRWNYLTLLAASATVVMQFGWVNKFFAAEKMPVATGIFLSFAALYAVTLVIAHRKERVDHYLVASAIILPLSAQAFALYLQARPYPALASAPALLFTLLFGADAALLMLAALRRELRLLHLLAGGVVFFQLIFWTSNFLKPEVLNWALGVYLLFGAVHAVFPVVLERLSPSGRTADWAHLFAPLALVLMMLPIFKLAELTLLVWPAVLLVDLLAIVLALLTASALAIVAVLLLTVLLTGFWIVRMPAVLGGLPEALVIVGAFAVLFFVVGIVVARQLPASLDKSSGEPRRPWLGAFPRLDLPPDVARALIPAMSAALPFLLLTLLTTHLPLVNPSPVFGLAALMVVLLLGVVRLYQVDWVALAGLAGTLLLEGVWQARHLDRDAALTPLIWYAAFYVVFGLFPFVFQRRTQDRLAPWLVSSLAGPAQFYLVYRLISFAFKNAYMGLVPAVFALPSLLALARLLKTLPAAAPRRNTQLALFGGVALFFVTLIFPIQYEKQWITLGWALEGAALLWLLHRVPHNGLKYVGVALLATAFVRLAVNPAVLDYHPRAATPIFNWYLYAYGIVAVCLFLAARLLAPPRNFISKLNVPPALVSLGTVLAFLLVNIEIADYFSTGATITFKFSGNFGRDMAYSLAWGVFAFVLLFVGILRKQRGARYAGLGLLLITLLKLFLHDLWSLGGLYRIGSLIGLALVFIPVSFLYQRFLSSKTEPTRPESMHS
jgi:uncharacterized membrane protein